MTQDPNINPNRVLLEVMLKFFLPFTLFVLFLALVSCRTQAVVIPQSHSKDSIRVEIRHDSVYLYEHDSVYIDRWRANDTVFITKERWKTRYKDKEVFVHDTISTTVTDSIGYPVPVPGPEVKVVPGFYKWSTWVCWIGIVTALLIFAWKIFKKFYLHM